MLRKWAKIESWHIVASEGVTASSSHQTYTTQCGLTRNSDGAFLDALPGGSEKSCENCLIVEAGGKPKKKTRP